MTPLLKKIHDDHRNYSILLALLNTDIDKIQQGEETDFVRLYDIMNYMTNHPDSNHHPVEEIIFKLLQQKTPGIANDVDKLVNEHRELADSGARLKEKLHYVTSGAIVSRDSIIEAASAYEKLLTSHINFEESKLLPLVESSFDDSDWEQIRPLIEGTEDPLFGEAVQEQFVNLFKRISVNNEVLS